MFWLRNKKKKIPLHILIWDPAPRYRVYTCRLIILISDQFSITARYIALHGTDPVPRTV